MLHGYVFAGFSRFMHHVPYFIIPVSIGKSTSHSEESYLEKYRKGTWDEFADGVNAEQRLDGVETRGGLASDMSITWRLDLRILA
jgi:hypothetical protein